MRPSPATLVVPTALAAAATLLAGCGTSSDAAGQRPPTTAATTPAPQSGEGTASPRHPLVLTGARVVEGDGQDRLVLTFRGEGTPGWQARYVARPVVDGSGEVLDLGGGATLDVYAADTTWPAPDYYDGPARLPTADGGAIGAAHVAGTFEGTTQVLVGLEGGPASYRVSTRTDPTRLVVEVDDPAR